MLYFFNFFKTQQGANPNQGIPRPVTYALACMGRFCDPGEIGSQKFASTEQYKKFTF